MQTLLSKMGLGRGSQRETPSDQGTAAPKPRSASPRKLAPTQPGPTAPLPFPVRYGIEVEHQGMSVAQLEAIVREVVGGNFEGSTLPQGVRAKDGRFWSIDYDAGGLELITPILSGPEDLAAVQQIVERMRQRGAVADRRAGLHVHLDAARFKPSQVRTLAGLLAANENWLYPAWGVDPMRRFSYCRPIAKETARRTAAVKSAGSEALAKIEQWKQKSNGLNISNYLEKTRCKNTLEFRYANGTVDAVRLGCTVGFYMALAAHALSTPEYRKAESCSLPTLLRELDADVGGPLAQDLRGLLKEQVEVGAPSREDPSAALNGLDAKFCDDAWVHDFSRRLQSYSTPADLAQLAASLPLDPRQRRHYLVTNPKSRVP